MTWVDGVPTLASADDALHSGITTDLLRGNLLRAISQSRYDVAGWSHDGDVTMTKVMTLAAGWVMFDPFNALCIPVRLQGGGAWRQYSISLDGLVTVGDGATVRVYLRTMWEADALLTVDSSDALVDENAYTELEFTNTGNYVTKSGTVTLAEVGHMPSPYNDVAGTRDELHPAVWMVIVAKVAANLTLRLRCPRIKEVL